MKSLGSGDDVDLALDGKGVTWVSGGKVKIRRAGRTSTVAPGDNPTISDLTKLSSGSRVWGVSFQTSANLVGRDHNSGLRCLRADVRRDAAGRGRRTSSQRSEARRGQRRRRQRERRVDGVRGRDAASSWFVNHD